MTSLVNFRQKKKDFQHGGFRRDTLGDLFATLVMEGQRLHDENQLEPDDYEFRFVKEIYDFSFGPYRHQDRFFTVTFVECEFKGAVNFRQIKNLTFHNCQIHELCMNIETTPLSVVGGSIERLSGSASGALLFNSVDISVFMPDTYLVGAQFTGCKFLRDVFPVSASSFERVNFVDCTFFGNPNFIKCTFSKDVKFVSCGFKNYDNISAVYFQDLKQKMSDNHDDLSAHLFGAHELKCKDHGLHWGIEKMLALGYRALNDYGLDPYRPLEHLFWLGLGSFVVWGNYICHVGPFNIEGVSAPAQMLYLTFVSVLGPLRVFGTFNPLKDSGLGSQVVLWCFTMMASILWFFLILAVRRRFKVN
ncbi:hypothetical protein ACES2J_08215 [Bdellovibrio bacteriovorus]|uniref:hypothetical protein n=1 Tax=Bdellovibrio bacteriovorus TaxID=959 RepID=UPI0035A60D63